MYFITTKRMLEVCFSAHPNIQYRTKIHSKIYSRMIEQDSCWDRRGSGGPFWVWLDADPIA